MLPQQQKKKRSLLSFINATGYNISSHVYNTVVKSKFTQFNYNFLYYVQEVHYTGEPQMNTSIRKHLSTLFRVTYRNGFSYHLPHCSLTTDAGWGCTLRSIQMLFLNSLVRLQEAPPPIPNGKNTEEIHDFIKNHLNVKTMAERREYVQLIEDSPNREAVLSLHKMFDVEVIRRNNQKGTKYLSPSTCATALSVLVELWENRPCHVLFSPHFPINIQPNTILMVSAPLTEKTINCLDSHFVGGVVCGVDSKAICVIGHSGNMLLLLDPHHVQKAHDDGNFDINDYSVRNKDVKMVGLTEIAHGNCIWGLIVRENNIEALREWCKRELGISSEDEVRDMVSCGDDNGFEILEF